MHLFCCTQAKRGGELGALSQEAADGTVQPEREDDHDDQRDWRAETLLACSVFNVQVDASKLLVLNSYSYYYATLSVIE